MHQWETQHNYHIHGPHLAWHRPGTKVRLIRGPQESVEGDASIALVRKHIEFGVLELARLVLSPALHEAEATGYPILLMRVSTAWRITQAAL